MNKKLAVVTGCAVLAITLSACGGGDDNSEETETWAKNVCDQVQPQVAKIQSATAAITEASEGDLPPSEVKETDARAFQDISDAYAALAQAVQQAGNPPVDDGPRLRRESVSELEEISGSYAGLKDTVDGLKTSDQAEFAQGLEEVADQLAELGQSGDEALRELQAGELGEAMAQQRGCQSPPAGQGSDSGTGEGSGDDATEGAGSSDEPATEGASPGLSD